MIVQRVVQWVVWVAAFLAVIRLSSAGREAAFGWGVLILVLSLCFCGIAQMAKDYLAHGAWGGRVARSLVVGVISSKRRQRQQSGPGAMRSWIIRCETAIWIADVERLAPALAEDAMMRLSG